MLARMIKIWWQMVFLCILLSLWPAGPQAEAMTWGSGWLYREGSSVLPGDQAFAAGGDREWKPFNYPGRPELSEHAHKIVLSRLLLPQEPQINTLMFNTANESVRLWLGDRVIYSYGSFTPKTFGVGHRWHMVLLPVITEPTSLSFELYSDDREQLGNIDMATLDTEVNSIKRLYIYDLPYLISFPVVVLFMLVMAVFYFFSTIGNKRIYLYAMLFLVVFAFWMTSASKVSLLLIDSPVFWWYGVSITAYLLPVSANLILYGLLKDEKGVHMDWIIGANLLLFSAAMIGEILGFHTVNRLLDVFYPMLAVGESLAAFWLIRAARQGNRLTRAALVPTILFTVLGLVDGIAGHFRLLPWHTFLTPLGIYGLAYLLIAMLRDQVLREQDLAMRNINLEYEAARAVERAETDPLTGAYNRHYLQAVMQSEGIKEPYSVLLFDIDHFKEINDTHGHDKGDAVLVSFAMILREGLDKDKLLVRWGGEEFLVLCPHMGIRMASRLGENLRKSVGSHFLAGLRLTCSIGAATWHGEEDTIEELFKRADQALYTAKESGRDRLVTENEITK